MFLSEVLDGILLTAGGAAGGKWGSEEDFSSQRRGGEGTGEERREKSLRTVLESAHPLSRLARVPSLFSLFFWS